MRFAAGVLARSLTAHPTGAILLIIGSW